MKRQVVWAVCLILILAGCSTTRSLRLKATDDFALKNFDEAERKLNSADVANENKNLLLTLMELGTVAHYKGEYLKSNLYFERARDISTELYNSIKENLVSFVMNDNSQSYRGMDYEHSLIYYYRINNYLNLISSKKSKAYETQELKNSKGRVIISAAKESEKIFTDKDLYNFLREARADVLAWDSFLETVRNGNKGEPYYKDDILAKLMGAFIHKEINTASDLQIAKGLYQDADQLMIRAYPSYPSFNTAYTDYISNYSKFEEMGEDIVKAKFVSKTNYFKALEKKIETSKNNHSKNNVLIVFENGIVQEKKAKPYVIGLSTVFKGIEDPKTRANVEMIGTHVLIELAPEVGFGVLMGALVGAAKSSDFDDEDKPKQLSEYADSAIGIEFKLPTLKKINTDEEITLVFKNKKTGEEITTPVTLINPMNDIAYLNTERRASSIAMKTGLRVGVKMIPGLIAAVGAYKATPDPRILKVMAGTAVWMASKGIVDSTEAADIRAWNMLPKGINMAELNLPVGEYQVKADISKNGFTKTYMLEDFEVKNQKINFYSSRAFYKDSKK